jgi:hypothetical protein
MKRRRHTTRLVALLMLLVLLAFLAFHRNSPADQTVGEAVVEFLVAGSMPLPDEYVFVACLVLVAWFGYVAWAVVREDKREDEAKPPPGNGARSASR